MATAQKNILKIARPPTSRAVPASARQFEQVEDHDWRVAELDRKLIGESPVMKALKQKILRAANVSSTVLITGESGTGKELIARGLHDLGPRREGPFVAVNCGALTESLLESELFGHVKGAFTGAAVYKKGVFESANKGTIFLDEFGEMPHAVQVRLLRVLQERKVRPVGATEAKEIPFDARVIVATNRDLNREVAEGRFRQDLYYRVDVLQVHSPPLRDRIEDLPLLASLFLERVFERPDANDELWLDTDAMDLMSAYSWPGNIRELENVIERLTLASNEKGRISAPEVNWALGLNETESPVSFPMKGAVGLRLPYKFTRPRFEFTRSSGDSISENERLELEMYLNQVEQVRGNLAEAARRLNIKRTTLHMRIKRLQGRRGLPEFYGLGHSARKAAVLAPPDRRSRRGQLVLG